MIWPHLTSAPEKYNLCVVSPDYRLAPQTRFPGILADIAAAMAYVRSPAFLALTNGAVDQSKIIVSGGSAGGWLALLAGTGVGFAACGVEPPAKPLAIAAIYPISDLEDPFWTTKQHPVSYLPRVIEKQEMQAYLDAKAPPTSASSPDSTRSGFYGYMVSLPVTLDQSRAQFLRCDRSRSEWLPKRRMCGSRDRELTSPHRNRGILASLLLDGTGISPKAFSIAPALASGEFTAPPTFIVHGT